MKIRRLFAILAALALILGTGGAEISCERIDELSPERQAMLDCALEQAEAWKAGVQPNFRELFAESEMMDEDLLNGIEAIPVAHPTTAVFFEHRDAQNLDASARSAYLGQTGICNGLIRYLEGVFLETTSLYALRDGGFSGVSYVVLCYAPELPVIVTAICGMGKEAAILKTGAVYGYGQYENELIAFAGPLLTRFGEDAFEMCAYRPES